MERQAKLSRDVRPVPSPCGTHTNSRRVSESRREVASVFAKRNRALTYIASTLSAMLSARYGCACVEHRPGAGEFFARIGYEEDSHKDRRRKRRCVRHIVIIANLDACHGSPGSGGLVNPWSVRGNSRLPGVCACCDEPLVGCSRVSGRAHRDRGSPQGRYDSSRAAAPRRY